MTGMTRDQQRAELHRTIWGIAETVRNGIDAWDFKQYVLGMLFYRYISEDFAHYIDSDEIKAGIDSFSYAALKDEDFEQLGTAVEKHYEGFDNMLLSQCPSLKQGLISLCHLHLLGINEREIAVLKNVSYSAIKKQNESLQEKLGVEENVAEYVLKVAERLCGTQNGTQGGPQTNGGIDDNLDAWIERQIKDNPKISTEELAQKSHKGVRTIKRHISTMSHIRYVGSGYSGHWEVVR